MAVTAVGAEAGAVDRVKLMLKPAEAMVLAFAAGQQKRTAVEGWVLDGSSATERVVADTKKMVASGWGIWRELAKQRPAVRTSSHRCRTSCYCKTGTTYSHITAVAPGRLDRLRTAEAVVDIASVGDYLGAEVGHKTAEGEVDMQRTDMATPSTHTEQ